MRAGRNATSGCGPSQPQRAHPLRIMPAARAEPRLPWSGHAAATLPRCRSGRRPAHANRSRRISPIGSLAGERNTHGYSVTDGELDLIPILEIKRSDLAFIVTGIREATDHRASAYEEGGALRLVARRHPSCELHLEEP